MYSDPSKIRRVTSIGAGPIGAGWAAHFLARGYDVTAYLHDSSETKAFNLILKTAWFSLTKLGLAEGASLARLSIVTDLETALDNADFVQESAPEQLKLKQSLFKQIDEYTSKNIQ